MCAPNALDATTFGNRSRRIGSHGGNQMDRIDEILFAIDQQRAVIPEVFLSQSRGAKSLLRGKGRDGPLMRLGNRRPSANSACSQSAEQRFREEYETEETGNQKSSDQHHENPKEFHEQKLNLLSFPLRA